LSSVGSRESRHRPRAASGAGRASVLLWSGAVLVVAAAAVWLVLRRSDASVSEGVARGDVGRPYVAGTVEAGDATGFNVLLVTLDTTRADRLGCYGCEWAETPTLDSLAARGVLFEDAVTNVPLTLPAHATVLTGLDPLGHGVHDNGRYHLSDDRTTLAEVLSSHGYDTAAFVSCFVLDARFGLDQGFETYDFEVSAEGYRPSMPDYNERPAAHVTDAAIEWLDSRTSKSAPFFLWVHYFDPHLPYQSPLQRLPKFSARPYDAEIAYADSELERLLDALDSSGRLDETVIVAAGDHGEALGEHGEPTHGMLVYEPTMNVPLIVSCRTLFDGAYRVGDRVVGLVDIMPTVENLLGVEATQNLDGDDLFAPASGAERSVYIETEMPLALAGWSPLRGVRTHTHKFILAPEPELYDLLTDPSESRNIYPDGGPFLERLEAELEELLEGTAPGRLADRDLTDEERERLGSLGYVQASSPVAETALPDPKSMMDVYSDALRCEELYGRRQYAEAAGLAESVIERGGTLLHAVRVLAFSYVRMGRADEAVDLLRGTTSKNPDVFLVRSLVQVLILEERYDDALDALELYASVDPLDGRVHLLRGDIHDRLDDGARALEEYEAAAALDEHRVGIMARERIERVRDR